MSGHERALAERKWLTDWLFRSALPLWSQTGTDWKEGGFFETIDAAGSPSSEPRRTRVVGRQLYAFAVGGAIGWDGPVEQLVEHALVYLGRCCLRDDGTIISASRPDGTVVNGAFDLYDHAFALFGLAVASGLRDDREAIAAVARKIRTRMKDGWGHSFAGFEESVPSTLPLKANPHMHMLEASLAWIEAGPAADDDGWDALADEIAELCLSRFIDSSTGALREFFDGDWRPIAGDEGRIVEPGHQFEWAWLLQRWGMMRGRADALAASRRLVEVAETRGVDPIRGVAVTELWDDLEVKDDTARLWQQTERIKGWLAMAVMAESVEEREHAYGKAADAARSLRTFLDHPIVGGAWENMLSDGSFRQENVRASSLYHLVCAIAELHRML